MKDILTLFPLKKRGAIVAALVFLLAFAIYYFVYYRAFVDSNFTNTYECYYHDDADAEKVLFVRISAPLILANGSKVSFYIENYIENFFGQSESFRLVPILHSASLPYMVPQTPLSFQPNSISLDQLGRDSTIIKSLEFHAMGNARERVVIGIKIVGAPGKRDIVCRSESYELSPFYHPLYGEMLNILESLPIMTWMMIFIIIGLCSFFDRETQEYPLHSRLGRYLAMLLFFKVSGVMALFFLGISLVGNLLQLHWVGGAKMLIALLLYFSVAQVMSKSLLRAIDLVPTARIVVDGSGREKEVELLSEQIRRSLKGF